MNLTEHLDQSRHTLLLFLQPAGLATLTEIFRIAYWAQCTLKNLSSNQTMLKNYVLDIVKLITS